MSRRFGRNQRRRAREALAVAASEAERFKVAYEMNVGLLSHVSAAKRELEDELEQAKEMVGRNSYSALFAPESIYRVEVRADARMRLDLRPVSELGDLGAPMEAIGDMTFTTVSLPTMLASAQLEDFRRNLHVLVQYEGGRWAYHVDRPTLEMMGPTRAVQEVSRYLARALVADVFKAVGGRAR